MHRSLAEIVSAIGAEGALRLGLVLGGRRLYIPAVAASVAVRRRRVETAVLRAAGLNGREIAHVLGGSDRVARRDAASPLVEVLHG